LKPKDFIDKWKKSTRTEKSAAQEHFLDVCELLEVEKPAEVDPDGKFFTFEKHVTKTGEKTGFVDVWRKDCFAWEYKRSYKGEFNHKNLVKAHAQAKQYADALENPPLLIVSDMKEVRIHTNFTNAISEQHVFKLPDFNDPIVRRTLKWCFTDPEKLRPDITTEGVTAKAAMALGVIAAKLGNKYEPQRVAHFLNKLVFCLFAEDIGLLPDDVFADIVEEGLKHEDRFPDMLGDLFRAMKDKNGRFGLLSIPWFNGGLFDDDEVLPLGFYEIRDLADAARLDWSVIEPAIFGSLFEGGLDPEKRKQMANLFDAYGVEEESMSALPGILAAPEADKGVGIHYTDPDTIMKIVEPVVLAPLRREWEEVKAEIKKKRKIKEKSKSDSTRIRAENEARDLYLKFRQRIGAFRVLDPACGSGNFLYLSLQHLKDFDLLVLDEAKKLDLPFDDQRVGPEAVRGIEINPYAAELARVTIWIGELQWQMKNGFGIKRSPVLDKLDGIVNKDALLNSDRSRVEWPEVNVVIGNPPFLGVYKIPRELGEDYTKNLKAAFSSEITSSVDLVMYWFLVAWAMISQGTVERAGLVATNSIRGGANRKVLDLITNSGRISEAWSDQPWTIAGAAVRVSIVCFDGKSDSPVSLDGHEVDKIYSDLSGGVDANVTEAKKLMENKGVCIRGIETGGPFEVDHLQFIAMANAPTNPNGFKNHSVLRRILNGNNILKRQPNRYVIDFSNFPKEQNASAFEVPFEHLKAAYQNYFTNSKRELVPRDDWWLHRRSGSALRKSIENLERFIVTPRVGKYRVFVWVETPTIADSATFVIARNDDVTFGILHSRFHELWSLSLCTWVGVGNDPRYTPSTTFETFPFPEGLTPDISVKEYSKDPRAKSIAEAARELNEFRENWLNPPDLIKREPEVVEGYPELILAKGSKAEKELKKRTLTNLYNSRPSWLDNAHKSLDSAVAAAYGWPDDLSDDEVLEHLLKLNQKRAKAEAKKDSVKS